MYLLAKTQRCRIHAVSGEKWQELEWGNLGLECESSLGHFPLESGNHSKVFIRKAKMVREKKQSRQYG